MKTEAIFATILGCSVLMVPTAFVTPTQVPDMENAFSHPAVGNITQTVGWPQAAADSRTVPQAAVARGGFTTREFAELLSTAEAPVSVREIQDRCQKGEIVCAKDPISHHYLIALSEWPGG